MWNFFNNHPIAAVFIVIAVCLTAVDVSGNIARAFNRK